jgi:perosamine synthetase
MDGGSAGSYELDPMSGDTAVARLAIDGGEPVRRKLLPYAHQSIDDDDIEAVTAALRSDWLTTGPRVPAFERELAAFTGARHAIAFSSGTAALHGATTAAGLGPGDEAITTPLTFVATANAVLYVGAEPRFADIDDGTLLIDADAVANAVTPRTKALLPVDYAGQPADYESLRAVADRAPGGPLTIIADASHSLGATWRGRSVGTLADMTVLSLHPAKILTTGEGGAVLTDRDDYAERLRRFRNHGIATELAARRDWIYEMVELGYNYRLTDIGAALGSSQLARIETFLARRRELAAHYLRRLAGHELLDPPVVVPGADPAWHFAFVQLRLDRLRVDRGDVFRALRAEGIGVNVHYIPVHQHRYYRERFPGLSLPRAEAAYERLLTVPLFASMTTADVDDVVAALDKVTTTYRAA